MSEHFPPDRSVVDHFNWNVARNARILDLLCNLRQVGCRSFIDPDENSTGNDLRFNRPIHPAPEQRDQLCCDAKFG
jgi:hypothetical protein